MDILSNHGIKVYTGIMEQLTSILDTEKESVNEVFRYIESFPKEVDYNLVQYGTLLVYYNDIRDFYKECAYPNIELMNDEKLWDMYRVDVGIVAAHIYANLKNK